jgi:DNA-binding Lrp family transcriptional regulator
LLRENARYSTEDLARQTGLDAAEVEATIQELEREGVVKGYRAIVDRNKVEESGTDQLTRTHHVHSLKYIMKLNNGTTATSVILDRWDSFAQGDDGL